MRLDLRALLQTVDIGAASRLFLITTPDIAAAWATVGDLGGGPAFPNATYNGGSAGGVPIVSTDGCPAGTIILADASGIAANQRGAAGRLFDANIAANGFRSRQSADGVDECAFALAIEHGRGFGASDSSAPRSSGRTPWR